MVITIHVFTFFFFFKAQSIDAHHCNQRFIMVLLCFRTGLTPQILSGQQQYARLSGDNKNSNEDTTTKSFFVCYQDTICGSNLGFSVLHRYTLTTES